MAAGIYISRQPFGPDYIKKQIEAVYDSGLDSYVVWNASNKYDATFAGMINDQIPNNIK